MPRSETKFLFSDSLLGGSSCLDECDLKPQDFGLGLVAFVALLFWRLPPWLVVLETGAAGWLMGSLI
jgi:hypothetical protein